MFGISVHPQVAFGEPSRGGCGFIVGIECH
jgi:hypothetical protein